jgi:hypothetical protein
VSAYLVGLARKARLYSGTRKNILWVLVDCCHEDGTRIFPSLKTLAEDAECSKSTARRILREFCAVGLLRRVRDGGNGAGSTAQYELDVELLLRLRRPETWPALEAAALHDPLPDGDDGVDETHASAAEPAGEAAAPCENKGVMVEAFHGGSLPNEGRRVPSDDTQPLSRSLSSEREGAREREGKPASEGEPAAGDPVPTFEDFLEAYPHAKGDNRVQLRAAWEALAFDQRRPAIDGIGAFIAERKAGGLKSRLSAPAYLSGRSWIGLEAKAGERKAAEAAGAPVAIAGWSEKWWLLLFDRIKAGRNPGFWMQQAEAKKPLGSNGAELAAAAKRIGELKPFLCNGPEMNAWRPWLAQRGARIPVFGDGSFRVFLPSERPPGGKRDDGDDDVAF